MIGCQRLQEVLFIQQEKHPLDVIAWFIKRVFLSQCENNLSSAMQLDRRGEALCLKCKQA